MKILQVCPKFLSQIASGSIRVAYTISKELVQRGHSVTVLASDAKDKYSRTKAGFEESDGIRIYRFKNIGFKFLGRNKLFITPDMIHVLKKEITHFDIIHLHEFRTFQNIVVHHYTKKYGVPYVLQTHGSLPRNMGKLRLKWIYDAFSGYKLLRNASKVLALSPVEARQYKGMGTSEEKIAIIPNGIDLLKHTNLPPKGGFKERYGIEKERKVVLYLGRINRFKGIEFLIDAFAYLIKNIKYANAILVIAGPNDGYLDETKRLIRQHKIEERILFSGPLFGIRKVEAYVDSSIVASLDSLQEVVFLLVPLEAAACGTPVIVTKSNYIATLVEKGNFGSWVEYGKVTELATRLKEMLVNEDLLKKMGLNGHKFVSDNFDWKSVVDKIERIYEEVVKRNQ